MVFIASLLFGCGDISVCELVLKTIKIISFHILASENTVKKSKGNETFYVREGGWARTYDIYMQNHFFLFSILGNVIVNNAPLPSVDSHLIVPPYTSTNALQNERPMP